MPNLHTHSEYSKQDAISKISDIIKRQKELGFDWFCITDHGTMAGMPEAFKLAKKNGMKFIPGYEAYIKPEDIFDNKLRVLEVGKANKTLLKKDSTEEEKAEAKATLEKWDERLCRNNYHLTLIAYNQTGLNNLFKMFGHTEIYYKPRLDLDVVKKFKDGIIVLSGCLGSQLAHYIRFGLTDKAESYIQDMKETFGDNFYTEFMFHGLQMTEEEITAGKLNEIDTYLEQVRLSKKYGIKMVCTNDSHYVMPEDQSIHDLYKKISYAKDGQELDTTSSENNFHGSGYHIVSEDEILKRFIDAGYNESDVKEMIANSREIVNKCLENTDIERVKELPDRSAEIRALVEDGWKRRRKGTKYAEESKRRIEEELEVINSKKFSGYFYNVWLITNTARLLGVLKGPGRGSGAGSEVVYLLGISDTDPIKYNLLFSRFINKDRNSMPDIDIDFCTF